MHQDNTYRTERLEKAAGVPEDQFEAMAKELIDEWLPFAYQGELDVAFDYYKRLVEIIEKRLGADHLTTAAVKMRLAMVYAYKSQWSEAMALAEQTLPVQQQYLGDKDQIVENTIANLITWYRNSGQPDKATALQHRQWERYRLCEHLQPLEDYILAAGGHITDRSRISEKMGVSEFIDVYLDLVALRAKLSLSTNVIDTESLDRHYFLGKGFQCTEHLDEFWGLHPLEKSNAKTIS